MARYMAFSKDRVIWGFGDTEEAAITDGQHWIDEWNETHSDAPASRRLKAVICLPEVEDLSDHLGGEEAGKHWRMQSGAAQLHSAARKEFFTE